MWGPIPRCEQAGCCGVRGTAQALAVTGLLRPALGILDSADSEMLQWLTFSRPRVSSNILQCGKVLAGTQAKARQPPALLPCSSPWAPRLESCCSLLQFWLCHLETYLSLVHRAGCCPNAMRVPGPHGTDQDM